MNEYFLYKKYRMLHASFNQYNTECNLQALLKCEQPLINSLCTYAQHTCTAAGMLSHLGRGSLSHYLYTLATLGNTSNKTGSFPTQELYSFCPSPSSSNFSLYLATSGIYTLKLIYSTFESRTSFCQDFLLFSSEVRTENRVSEQTYLGKGAVSITVSQNRWKLPAAFGSPLFIYCKLSLCQQVTFRCSPGAISTGMPGFVSAVP